MSVSLQNTPVTNTLNYSIRLSLNGADRGILAAGAAKVIDVNFDEVTLFIPPNPPVMKHQNPAAAVAVNPGEIGLFRPRVGGGIVFEFAQPCGLAHVVDFT